MWHSFCGVGSVRGGLKPISVDGGRSPNSALDAKYSDK